jgi:hypothetical protein
MNRSILALALSTTLLGALGTAQAADDGAEHNAMAATAEELRLEHQLAVVHGAELSPELEPCINGGVSASGTFADDELEQAVESVSDPRNLSVLEGSDYFRLVLQENRVQIR